jgi:aspartyl-tRNA(Asn)/glutamyl-tRNA(Gln) amidotransferase subunit C
MDKDKVLSLAQLARIDISEAEAEKLSGEFEAILDYVSEVKKITPSEHSNNLENVGVFNVMRPDANPHEGGLYTEKLLEQAPARDRDYIKVKKIL